MRPRLLSLLAIGLALLAGVHPCQGADPARPTATNALSGIVFVGAPIFDEKTDGGEGAYQGSYHWRDGYVYPRSATFNRAERTMGPPRSGRNLYALIPARPDGKLTRLTHLKTGMVFRPEPSYDGTKVLFALRRDGEDWFHLCEINVDGTGPRQLTDGPFNDFGGAYLPDGRIVFCSDRTGYLDEYHEERTETLFVMNGDGSGIKQLTFLPGTYFEPSVLRDGRILFSFWDAFHIDLPPFDKHETYLATVNPDGGEERHLFGAGQYRFFNRERHSAVGLTQAHEMPDGRILCQSEMGPALLDPNAGLAVREALTPLFPGTTSAQIGGTTHRVHLSPLGTRSTPYPLQDGRFLCSITAPGARDSAVYVCDPETRREELILNIPNYAEFDAVPVLVQRPRPAILPAQGPQRQPVNQGKKTANADAAEAPTTRFLVVAGRIADNPQRQEALQRARYFRIVEAEYSGVTTSSHTNLETRILGVVPIQPDGSAYFEAPADTPLFLDPLDAAGNRILMEWSYPNTSVAVGTHHPATQMAYMSGRPGQTRACYGCHAPQTDAVPNSSTLALLHEPVLIRRHSTDVEYRRNEPEAYRTRARIDTAGQYRPWLASKDSVLRARACEMLMNVENGTERDVPRLMQLLEDEEVEVRRAAALALTRLATHRQHKALIARSRKETDWLVKFHLVSVMASAGCIDEGSTDWERIGRQEPEPDVRRMVRQELAKPLPNVLALRAAGKLEDPEAVKLLVPWLRKHAEEYHAAEAAVALGRIGTAEAVAALWDAARSEIPLKQVHLSRYFQHGPRPEEYALLKGLILAGAKTDLRDVPLLLALLPNTFMEKPRFEDRLRPETQRTLMPRLLLEKAGFRARLVKLLLAALGGKQEKDDPLYAQLLKGINLERPFSEHGRPFPVVAQIGAEEALWLLTCLLDPAADLPTLSGRAELEAVVRPFLTSRNHRERIDAAVLLGITGFGSKATDLLAVEIGKPYSFGEIASMGKGMPDDNFRDKAYFIQTLARHIEDVGRLRPFTDPTKMTRDIRYGLTHGLALRGKPDGIPLLAEMATRDPIALVRQQARYALADLQDICRLAGKPVPEVTLLEAQPLEGLYPPRELTWRDTSFVEFERQIKPPPTGAAALTRYVEQCLAPSNFRDLNNGQASGAQHMMIRQVEETRQAFAALVHVPGEAGRLPLLAALDSPYPYAHYLAAQALAERDDRAAIPALLKRLEASAKSADTVSFWWCCETLARLQAKEAVPVLAKYATATNPPNTFGPEGMAIGYVAAQALARLTADPTEPMVARLLKNDNVWLRAGALRGLAEAKAPGVGALLRQAADSDAALVRTEAQMPLPR